MQHPADRPADRPVDRPVDQLADQAPPSGPAPLIGVSAYAVSARWGVWDAAAVLVPRAYVDAVVEAGGVPVLLPPLPGLIEQVTSRLDGLLLIGGPDVDPARYGAERGPDTQPAHPDRDAAELALLAAATSGQQPVLAICRGMQLLNVARGGTLHQHLPDLLGDHDGSPGPGLYGTHPIKVADGTRLADALGRTALEGVPAYHHQGVDRLADGLVASAWTPDGLIEAVEDPALPFCVGVQWHPEVGEDLSVFRALVRAARDRRP
ncbi:MAG: gamma-glutamyl-gamma-aminobutyrate hydrolase family protein [Kineosporiaceae bacterium]|nr:gamma-glutamyl-gamma-aminobutyrate hydrolase family protein [Kineosporiaceae bacterium]